jgi:hypothetical protein
VPRLGYGLHSVPLSLTPKDRSGIAVIRIELRGESDPGPDWTTAAVVGLMWARALSYEMS